MAKSESYILSNLWDGIKNGAAWDQPVVFNRTNALPVDKWSVFNSLSAAEDYAINNPIAYPGQIINIVDDATSAVSTYKIEVDSSLTQIDKAVELSAQDGLSVETVTGGYNIKINELELDGGNA